MTDEQKRKAAGLYDDGLNDIEIGGAVGTSRSTIRRWREATGRARNQWGNKRAKETVVKAQAGEPPPPESDAERIEDRTSGDVRNVNSIRSERVRSLDDLLDAAAVDRDVWEVDRYTVNKWEVGTADREGTVTVTELFQVKAYLKRNTDAQALRDLEDRVIARMEAHAPVYPIFPRVIQWNAEPHMFEVSPFDLHLGKLAWGEEVDDDNFDSRIASSRLMHAIEALIARARGFAIEQVLFPVGNDLLHTDTAEGTTTRGTRQDVDTRPLKMFVAAEKLMVAAIDRLMEVAPVKVIVVPGNHDREKSLMLGRVLAAWYNRTDRVEVDAAPTMRKYVRYGINLLGFTHGSEERPDSLPLIMAAERPVDWAEAKHREWHTGHLHKRKETKYIAGDTHGGVPVRILPSLSGTDYWHYSKGYVKGQRAAEAYLWARDSGYAGHFSSNVMDKAA